MGGDINLQSQPGKGSVFIFTVETEIERVEKAELNLIKQPGSVLLFENNSCNRRVLKEILSSFGLEVLDYASLNEAEKDGLPSDISAVISDHDISEAEGFSAINRLRQVTKNVDLPVILLCCSDSKNSIPEGMSNADLLFKPVKKSELFKLCEKFFSERLDKNKSSAMCEDENLKRDPGLIRILVAEDNSINQLLLKAIVKGISEKIEIIEAWNGREAVDKFSKLKPDLILMDIQMPEMDGVEATQRIRSLENCGVHVPIIALTAGAVKGEKERCFEAGMDAFVIKPIDRKLLVQHLHELIPGGSMSLSEKNETLKSLEHFDRHSLLSGINNDHEIYESLISHVRSEFPALITRLEEAVLSAQSESVKKLAHKIRGISMNMHFPVMTKIAAELESSCGRKNESDSLFEKIRKEWELVQKHLI